MTLDATVSKKALDPRGGMTFGELRAFVTEAMKADVPDDTVVQQTATWRSTIKELKASTQVRAG